MPPKRGAFVLSGERRRQENRGANWGREWGGVSPLLSRLGGLVCSPGGIQDGASTRNVFWNILICIKMLRSLCEHIK